MEDYEKFWLDTPYNTVPFETKDNTSTCDEPVDREGTVPLGNL